MGLKFNPLLLEGLDFSVDAASLSGDFFALDGSNSPLNYPASGVINIEFFEDSVTPPMLYLGKNRGTREVPVIPNGGDELGEIIFSSGAGDGVTYCPGAIIKSELLEPFDGENAYVRANLSIQTLNKFNGVPLASITLTSAHDGGGESNITISANTGPSTINLNAPKILLSGALGVGNSATATVAVGSLANKIEVFDALGVSLGFIPVYTTIT